MGAPLVQAGTSAVVLLVLPAVTGGYTSGSTVVFDTSGVTYGALDVTLTSFSGGSSPTATFTLQRQGADGVWYTAWTSGAQNGAVTYSIDLSPSVPYDTTAGPNSPAASVHNVFTAMGRFVYAFGGSPTSVNFSASLIGR